MSGAPSIPAPAEAAVAGGAATAEERGRLADLLPVGWRASVAVLAAVALSAVGVARFGLTGHALLGVVFMSTLVLLAAIDLQHRLLPNAVVLPATLAVLVVESVAAPADVPAHLLAGLALASFFLVFALLRPVGLGMGDVKLGLLIGVALGYAALGAMLITSVAVFLAAASLVATRGLGARRRTIAFGPFLALGGIAAFLLS